MNNVNYLVQICSKCRKPISSILEPCPNCGHQHPLTEAGKELALKKKIEKSDRKREKDLGWNRI